MENLLGYNISSDNLDGCLTTILDWIDSSASPKTFFCGNPHSLIVADIDHEFRKALSEADFITPDGVGIVLASKILGGKIRSRVTGSDVFTGLSDILNKKQGYSYFFLGSTGETLESIKDTLATDYPNIFFAGSYSPLFKREFAEKDNRLMIEAINAVKPDVLWVGMTAPKQEKWIHLNKDYLQVKFIGAIGAVFDFYAGKHKRAPQIIQKTGMEWLWRLIHEPRRLFKRNLISTPRFLIKVLRARIINQK